MRESAARRTLSETLCGTFIIMFDVGAAIAPRLRGVFGAISSAMP
jgi:hypothetical protein